MTNPDPLYPGNSYIRKYTFKDEDGELYDPTTITATLTDPADQQIEALDITSFTRLSLGVYKLQYKLPADAADGLWHNTVNATYPSSGLDTTKVFSFIVGKVPETE